MLLMFWTLAAGLVALALWFVAWPLLRPAPEDPVPDQDALNLEIFRERLRELDTDRATGTLDESQYQAARRDLEREVLRDVDPTAQQQPRRMLQSGGRWLAIPLAILVPLGAIALYAEIGTQEAIDRSRSSATHLTGPDGQTMPPLDTLVERLAERLASDPDNIEGWLMLGRTYFVMRQPERALESIRNAYERAPDQVEVLIAYAEALAVNHDNQLEGQPARLIQTALELEPDHPSVRWLSGMLYYQRGQFNAAASSWQRILDGLEDPRSEEADNLRDMIAEARARQGGGDASAEEPAAVSTTAAPAPTGDTPESTTEPTPETAAASTLENTVSASDGTHLQVTVTLAPELMAQTSPEDSVFVFAVAESGPPMPLAAQRLQVRDLPAEVRLDDGMAVMPTMRLSAFPRVVVGARVSKSGSATPQSGDLEGRGDPIEPARTASLSIVIDRFLP